MEITTSYNQDYCMFKNPFSFEGRIRRTEYALSVFIYDIAATLLTIVTEHTKLDSTAIFVLIPFVWFMIAQGTKRCHDRGNSGWYQLVPFYELWMLFADSERGENKYGSNPKGIGNHDELNSMQNPMA